MQSNIKEKAINSLVWRFLERCGAQGVSFIVSIIIARLLAPEAYGTIALVTVFTAILQVFIDSGLGNALIQKKDADDLDFSSVFYFNVFMCICLYLLLYFCAPIIADFYDNPELVNIIRVLGIILIISGVKNVQQAYVSRNLQFKRFFFATLGGTIGAAVVGITLAYLGYGVWALVAQHLFNATIDTIILWITVRWRPKRVFSFQRLIVLINYGYKLLLSRLIDTVYLNLRSLIIGKMYSSEDLAYYNKGGSFPVIVVTNINSSIDSVLLPTMSSVQDKKEAVKDITRRAIMISSFIMWPMMIGLAVISKPMIMLLLTDKWIMAVPFLQIACFSYGLEPLQTANLNAIKAMGRSDIILKLEIIKKTISVGILLFSMKYGVMAIALSGLVYTMIATMLNAFPNNRLLNYSYFEQVRDIIPSFLVAVLMGAILYPIMLFHWSNIVTLMLQIIIGAVVYFFLSVLLKLEPCQYIISTIKSIRERKKESGIKE